MTAEEYVVVVQIELQPNSWIAVIFVHPSYGTPDFAREAMAEVRRNSEQQGLKPVTVSRYGVEFNNGCRVRLLDEDKQDQQSRGYRFDAVYLHPPAINASWVLRAIRS